MNDSPQKLPTILKSATIHSIRLSLDLLRIVFRIINEEYESIKSVYPYCELTIVYTGRNKDQYHYYDTQSFLDHVKDVHNLKNFKQISLWLSGSKEKDLKMELNIGNFESSYTVSGTDSKWVREVRQHLAEEFAKHKTRNDFFHLKKTWIIWFIIGLILALLYSRYIPNPLLGYAINVLFWTGGFAFYLIWLFTWLFPKIETEYMIQTKIRKWVLGGLATIPFGVIVNYISSTIHR
jgi:hypothetical protein